MIMEPDITLMKFKFKSGCLIFLQFVRIYCISLAFPSPTPSLIHIHVREYSIEENNYPQF